ncbi:MAG TPA: hypothetical protein ENG66_00055 [Thermococcus sp.]|nr:hypothetical protein [Thermococcus sp.]
MEPDKWLPEVKRRYQIDLRAVLKNADEQTKKAFLTLYQLYNDALSARMEAEEREKRLLAEKIESDLVAKTSMGVTEKITPGMATLTEKLENIMGQLAPMRIKEQEAWLRMAGAEAMAGTAWETADSLVGRLKLLAREMEIPERERLLEELRDLITDIIKMKREEKVEKEE